MNGVFQESGSWKQWENNSIRRINNMKFETMQKDMIAAMKAREKSKKDSISSLVTISNGRTIASFFAFMPESPFNLLPRSS